MVSTSWLQRSWVDIRHGNALQLRHLLCKYHSVPGLSEVVQLVEEPACPLVYDACPVRLELQHKLAVFPTLCELKQINFERARTAFSTDFKDSAFAPGDFCTCFPLPNHAFFYLRLP